MAFPDCLYPILVVYFYSILLFYIYLFIFVNFNFLKFLFCFRFRCSQADEVRALQAIFPEAKELTLSPSATKLLELVRCCSLYVVLLFVVCCLFVLLFVVDCV